jgi:hypothetical protein
MTFVFRFILVTGCIGLLYLILGFHTDPQDYGAKTRSHLKYVKLCVAICEEVSKKRIVDSITERSPYLSIGFLGLSNTFVHYKNDLVDDTNATLNAYLLDGWGVPFNVDLTTNVIHQNDLRWGILTNCEIVIWSSGANHKDDRCTGDDMVWLIDDHLRD